MTSETPNATWPLPGFYYSVLIGGISASFQEVTGLDDEAQAIDRQGDSPAFSPIKLPGLGRVGSVTLHRGIFITDARLWNWYSQIQMNTIARQTVVITLLDQTGTPQRVWTLNNAWPTKITGTDLKSDGNEVAVESLEVAYETLTVSKT